MFCSWINAVESGTGMLLATCLAASAAGSGSVLFCETRAREVPRAAQSQDLNGTTVPVAAATVLAPRTLLWVNVVFEDDPIDTRNTSPMESFRWKMDEANRFFEANSQGRFRFNVTFVPEVLVVPPSYRDVYDNNQGGIVSVDAQPRFRTKVIELLRAYDARQGSTGRFLAENYDHEVIFYKAKATPGGGGAVSGWGDNPGRTVYLAYFQQAYWWGFPTGVIVHELGHNFGLPHANRWIPSTSDPIGPGNNENYGNHSDVMGLGQVDGLQHLHYTNWYKARLGWIPPADVVTLTGGTQRIRLYRHDHARAAGARMVLIPKSASQEYYLEFRPGNLENPLLRSGLLVGWGNKTGSEIDQSRGAEVLDMTPQSTPSFEYDDSALLQGRTFSDPQLGLHITPIGRGGSTPSDYIDVAVNFSAGRTNRAPIATAIRANASSVRPGAPIELRVEASDPDGDDLAYYWDFSDGSQPENKATVTRTFPTAEGVLVVKCEVSDMRGGRSTVSLTLPVEKNTLRSWERSISPAGSVKLVGVAFGNGRFVAVGDPVGVTGTVITSDDGGGTWRKVDGVPPQFFTGVNFINNRFVACHAVGMLWSDDGVIWNQVALPAAYRSRWYYQAAFGAGRYAFACDAAVFTGSAQFDDWQNTPLQARNAARIKSPLVVYAGGRFLSYLNDSCAVSSDGMNWEPRYDSLSFSAGAIAAMNGRYLATRNFGGLSVSENGIDWASFGASRPSMEGTGIAVFGDIGCFVVGKSSFGGTVDEGTIGVFSSDLTNLKFLSPVVNKPLLAVAYGAGRFVAVGHEGAIVRSDLLVAASFSRPTITSQPTAQSVLAGYGATLSVAVASLPATNFQWFKNGSAIPGATLASLGIPAVATSDAGSYSVVTTNPFGSDTSEAAQITVRPNPGRLINLSILTALAAAGDAFAVGTVIGGGGTSGPKPLLVRAVGPSLAAFGVGDVLSDPRIELFTGATKSGENDNWGGNQSISSAMAQVGAFPLTVNTSKDAAIYAPAVASGASSVVVSAVGGVRGTVIVELYDATVASTFNVGTPRLVNVSVLKHIGSELTAGFVIGGLTPATVLVRAVGPGLAAFGVNDFAADPQMTLFSGQAKVGENDNWGNAAALSSAFSTVGAFALPGGSKDAALLARLLPGSYTVKVSGVGDTTGVALVEVYEVP